MIFTPHFMTRIGSDIENEAKYRKRTGPKEPTKKRNKIYPNMLVIYQNSRNRTKMKMVNSKYWYLILISNMLHSFSLFFSLGQICFIRFLCFSPWADFSYFSCSVIWYFALSRRKKIISMGIDPGLNGGFPDLFLLAGFVSIFGYDLNGILSWAVWSFDQSS